jgi:hypothetical protein
MNRGVPQTSESPGGDSLAAGRKPRARARANTLRGALILLASLFTMLFASSALGATASVGLGTAASFSVLAGSTVTNTGPTTMFGDLGLSPGSSVTGAPHVLGATHVDDAVAIGAKNALTTAYNNAAGRPSNGSAGTDLAGQVFLPGVRTASSSLLLSSGSVTLDAQGNPDAVFIFQIASTLITASNTSVLLINGAQACNVFWQVGSSATLGHRHALRRHDHGLATITANTAATIHGRLLASTGAVNLDTNTITTSNCAIERKRRRRRHGNGRHRNRRRRRLHNHRCQHDETGNLNPENSRQTQTSSRSRAAGTAPSSRRLHRMSAPHLRPLVRSALGAAIVCLAGASAGLARIPATAGAVTVAAAKASVQATQELVVLSRVHDARRGPEAGSPQVAIVAAARPITGEPTTLPVLARSIAPDGGRWLLVLLPGRPNGASGWIEERGTRPSVTVWSIVVDLSARRVRVYREGRLVRVFQAVVGKPSTPTPTGELLRRREPADAARRARRSVRAGAERPLERAAGIRRRPGPDRDPRA